MLKKKVAYKVQCAHDKDHLFDIVVEVEQGSEANMTSSKELYCPFCGKMVKVTVKGKLTADIELLRKFGLDKLKGHD